MQSNVYSDLPGHHSRKTSNEDQKGYPKRIMQQLDAAECFYQQTNEREFSAENDLRFSQDSITNEYCFVKMDPESEEINTDEDSHYKHNHQSQELPQNQIILCQHTRTKTVDSFGDVPVPSSNGYQMRLISDYHQDKDSAHLRQQEETQHFGEALKKASIIFEEHTTLENNSNPYTDDEEPCPAPQLYIDHNPTIYRRQNSASQNLYESFHLQEPDTVQMIKDCRSSGQNTAYDFEPVQERCNMLVWGSNNRGQLGLGERLLGEVFRFPHHLSFTHDVLKVSCGQDHAALLTQSKMLYVMGSNQHGQLGIGSFNQKIEVQDQSINFEQRSLKQCSSPALVDRLGHLQVNDVSCGGKHTIVIVQEVINQQKTYSVYTWGDNSKGQLGSNKNDLLENGAPQKVEFKVQPQSDEILRRQGIKIDKISAGHEHSVFLDSHHSLAFACGEARFGQLGIGKQMTPQRDPCLIDVLQDKQVVDIAAGRNHTLASTYEGNVYATGLNSSGQLGMGHQETLQMFQQVPHLRNVVKIAAASYSGAIDCDGKLFVWGFWGTSHSLEPRQLRSPLQNQFDQISIGDGFGVALDVYGKVYAWGSNELGQLGVGFSQSSSKQQNEIHEVKILSDKGIASDVICGQNFVIAKMSELYPQTLSNQDSQQDIAKANAKLARQLFQMNNYNNFSLDPSPMCFIPTESTKLANISPNFDQGSGQQWITSPQLKDKKSVSSFTPHYPLMNIKTHQEHPSCETLSPRQFKGQHSITTSTSMCTQFAMNPTHIAVDDKLQRVNEWNPLAETVQQRFERSNPPPESRKIESDQLMQDCHVTIQSDQVQRFIALKTHKHQEQERKQWDSFGQIENNSNRQYERGIEDKRNFNTQQIQTASLKQIVGARAKSTSATRQDTQQHSHRRRPDIRQEVQQVRPEIRYNSNQSRPETRPDSQPARDPRHNSQPSRDLRNDSQPARDPRHDSQPARDPLHDSQPVRDSRHDSQPARGFHHDSRPSQPNSCHDSHPTQPEFQPKRQDIRFDFQQSKPQEIRRSMPDHQHLPENPTDLSQLVSDIDLKRERKEQRERKRKQKELERKFSQMQQEYFENKVRREAELQNVYMHSHKDLQLATSTNVSRQEIIPERSRDECRSQKENIAPNRYSNTYKNTRDTRSIDSNLQQVPVQDSYYLNQASSIVKHDRPRSMPRMQQKNIQNPSQKFQQPVQQLQPISVVQSRPKPHPQTEMFVVNRYQIAQNSYPSTDGTNTYQTNTFQSTEEKSYPTTVRQFNEHQQSPHVYYPNDNHQTLGNRRDKRNKLYDNSYVIKLRKKYKKIKLEQKLKLQLIQDQTAEIEHLRVSMTDLKNQVSFRKQQWQKKLKEREDQSNRMTRQTRADMAVLQEQVLTAERMYQCKESDARLANQHMLEMSEQVNQVEAEMHHLREQLRNLQAQNEQLKVDNEGLIKKGFEKDHHIREMKQHMELRNMCIQEAESTIKEQSKGMQKMSNYLQEAQTQVELKDESVKEYSRQIETLFEEQSNLKRQIEQLKQFINELETNNMELMRFIDNKNYREAEDYRCRVNGMLKGRKEEGKQVASMNDSAVDINLQNMINSKTFSPIRQDYQSNSLKPLPLNSAQQTLQRHLDRLDQRSKVPPTILTATNYDTLSSKASKDPQEVPYKATPEINHRAQSRPVQTGSCPLQSLKGSNLQTIVQSTNVRSSDPSPVPRSASIKNETAMIVERAGKMIEKLGTLNRRLGNRPLVQQEETEALGLIQQSKSVPDQQQVHKSFEYQNPRYERNKKQEQITSFESQYQNANIGTTPSISQPARAKSYEDDQQPRAVSRNSQTIGNGLTKNAQHQFQSEPEIILQNTQQSWTSDMGIRTKSKNIAVYKNEESLSFPAITKQMMRKELESINSTLAQMKQGRSDLDNSMAKYSNSRY